MRRTKVETKTEGILIALRNQISGDFSSFPIWCMNLPPPRRAEVPDKVLVHL